MILIEELSLLSALLLRNSLSGSDTPSHSFELERLVPCLSNDVILPIAGNLARFATAQVNFSPFCSLISIEECFPDYGCSLAMERKRILVIAGSDSSGGALVLHNFLAIPNKFDISSTEASKLIKK